MPKKKKPLSSRLQDMSEDIQISGDVNFRAMGCAAVLGDATGTLTDTDRRDMERLLCRANRLLNALEAFWNRHEDLAVTVDIGEVAASDGLSYAMRFRDKPPARIVGFHPDGTPL